jgi:hypothetical protein
MFKKAKKREKERAVPFVCFLFSFSFAFFFFFFFPFFPSLFFQLPPSVIPGKKSLRENIGQNSIKTSEEMEKGQERPSPI